MPSDGSKCKGNAQFRAVSEGDTEIRLQKEVGALNARRNDSSFTLRLLEH